MFGLFKKKVVKSDYTNSSNRRYHLETSSYNIEDNEVWSAIDFPWGPHRRANGEVIAQGMGDVRIAGINKYEGVKFILNSVPAETQIWLQREPNNPKDEFAIEVYGKGSTNGDPVKLGYIPKMLAKSIGENYNVTLPLEAEPRLAGVKPRKSVAFFSINILLPPAALRKKYKI
jgi:hypothetical protein